MFHDARTHDNPRTRAVVKRAGAMPALFSATLATDSRISPLTRSGAHTRAIKYYKLLVYIIYIIILYIN